jgi:hypothetical protein
MCELLRDLLGRQDAPDSDPDGVRIALALPLLEMFLDGGGVGLVTPLTVIGYPMLVPLLTFHRFSPHSLRQSLST